MSLLFVCSMILSLFTGLSVTALAGDVDPATATPTPTAASAFESAMERSRDLIFLLRML